MFLIFCQLTNAMLVLSNAILVTRQSSCIEIIVTIGKILLCLDNNSYCKGFKTYFVKMKSSLDKSGV